MIEIKLEYSEMLHPAVNFETATGGERKACKLCGKKFSKGERIIELFSSAFASRCSFTNRFHTKCFARVLAHVFPEITFDEELRKEVLIDSLEK